MADNDNIGSNDGGNAAPTNLNAVPIGEPLIQLSATPPTPRVMISLMPVAQAAAQSAGPVGETAAPPTPLPQTPPPTVNQGK